MTYLKIGDRTGLSAAAVLGYKDQTRYNDEGDSMPLKEMVYKHIFTIGIQAPPNSEIYFQKIRDFIHYLKYTCGWNIAGVSFDGFNSVDMRQQMELDGFKSTIISLDRDDKGYNTFRTALAEKRISMIDLPILTKEITALERNANTGKIDHPPQSVSHDSEGRVIKSVGKDEADSLCGAIYNASISVDMKTLDHMESVTIAEPISTLSNNNDIADQMFGFTQGPNGVIQQIQQDNRDPEEIISDAINKQIKDNQEVLQKIKSSNKNTKLSDQELLDMYSEFDNGGFVIF